MQDQLLPVRTAWTLCGIGKTKFYALAEAGVFVILKQGWRSYITLANLRAYQASLPRKPRRG